MNDKETVEYHASEYNGKTLEMLAEICDNSQYEANKSQIVYQLISDLCDEGYHVKCTFEKMAGGNGEYSLYDIKNNGKNYVFTGTQINSSIAPEITKKLTA